MAARIEIALKGKEIDLIRASDRCLVTIDGRLATLRYVGNQFSGHTLDDGPVVHQAFITFGLAHGLAKPAALECQQFIDGKMRQRADQRKS